MNLAPHPGPPPDRRGPTGPWHLAWALRGWLWAEWRAHPWRQLVAVLALALGVALAWSVHLIHASALAEFGQAMRSVQGEPDLSLAARQGEGLPMRTLDVAALHPQVRVASPRVVVRSVLRVRTPAGAQPRSPLAVQVLGVDALNVMAVAPDLMPRPDAAEAADAAPPAGGEAPGERLAVLRPDRAFVNPALAQALAGATELTWMAQGQARSLRVAGTVAVAGGPTLVLDVAEAQLGLPTPPGEPAGLLSQIDLRLWPGADRAQVQAQLLAALPEARVRAVDEDEARLSNLSRAYRVNLSVLALVALVVGAYLVFSVMALAVAQRTPALALLGVLGLPASGRQHLVLLDGGLTGALGSVLGLILGTGLAALALRALAGDLGSGLLSGTGVPGLVLDGPAALGFGALGTVAAMLGGAWPARQAARLAPAQALKGLGADEAATPPAWPGLLALAGAAGLALLPPVGGVPLAAYGSVGLALVGGIGLLPVGVRLALARGQPRAAVPLLALARARFARHMATAAVSGVVASLALCVAITVMVHSFRSSVADWLNQVLPADVYARAAPPGSGAEQLPWPPGFVTDAAALPGVARVQASWVQPLVLDPDQPAVALVVRDTDDGRRPLASQLPLTGPVQALTAGEVGVFVSEAVVARYGVQAGQRWALPLGAGPRPDGRGEGGAAAVQPVRVLGVWRDYARQFGSVALADTDHLRLTGDTRRNELVLWLAPGAAPAAVQQGLKQALAARGGAPDLLALATTAELRQVSLRIFDRSFAVTRYLQGVAIVIGLAGVAASLSAQVLARRREFGLLRHLGLTRRQLLGLVMLETICWLAVGVALGLLLGGVISAVLVLVVNPQSFHWHMAWRVPVADAVALAAAVLLAGAATSLLAARQAASADVVRAVREDH